MTLDLAALDRIEALRQQAVTGPWAHVPSTDMVTLACDDDDVVVETNDDVATAAYLAALSPEVVGELLRLARERLEQAERNKSLNYTGTGTGKGGQ